MQGREARSSDERAVAPASVLVIEDNAEMRTTLTSVLRRAGYTVHASENGREALALLDTVPAPDLIVLDLVMPLMTGWEFRVAQRRVARLAEVPVIVLSANHSAEAKAIDADAYLPKPFDARSLLHAVEMRLLAAERRRLEKRSAELARLSSLGVLTAGIAHEVNNPLAIVSGSIEVASKLVEQLRRWDTPPSPEALDRLLHLLADATTGVARVAAVVRAVGTFAHPQSMQASVVNVGDVLASCIRLVSNEIRHRARLTCEFDDQLRVFCNAAQLGQVFINLLTNAAHAIEDGDPQNNGIRVAAWRTAEGRTIVEFSDTGVGIAPENLSRVFDPFYTTKGSGAGIGLGLSISQRLVGAWGGSISVTSTLGEGARFQVDLPSCAAPLDVADASAPAEVAEREAARLRIMVIDDELPICELVGQMLEDVADVETFSDPRAALAALQHEPDAFDVVLTDMMMPELSGMDLYRLLARSHPALASRMVFMTGGTFTARVERFLEQHGVEPLHKPFSAEELLEKIAAFARVSLQ